jgi:glycosyltransferase involved in cell wall biosynthesis
VSKSKVLFVFKLPPPINGATVVNNNIFSSTKIKKQFACTFINYGTTKKTTLSGKLTINKFVIYLNALGRFLIKVLFNRYDLVYLTIAPTGTAFFKDSIFVLFSKIFSSRVIIHLHGKGIRNAAEKNSILNYYYKWIFKNTKVICLSEILMKDIQEIYLEKPFILPNGIGVPEGDWKINDKKIEVIPKIIYLSNFIKSKGVLDLIEALEILKRNDINFSAQLIGAPSDEIDIIKITKLIKNKKLDQFIDFVGPKYHEEKYSVLSEANIFVFPTYYVHECFPLVILEAMAFGLPVISTSEGAISEIVEDGITGYIIGKKAPKEIASKIIELVNQPEVYANMSRNSRAKYNKSYTLQQFEDNLIKIFSKVIINET